MTAGVELRGVSKTYGSGAAEVHALQDVDLTVTPGELVAVMGASGSGKSTLLTIAGTLEDPSGGSVIVSGADVSELSRNQRARLRRQSIGYVFQDFNLLAGLSVAENVSLPLELDGIGLRQARVAALEALERVGVAQHSDRFPDELSGGERQRVAVARAIVGKRDLLLADEPTGALDSVNGETVMRLLRAACAEGVSGIIVTHDAQLAPWAHRVVFLRDGRVVDQTAPPRAPESLLTGDAAVTVTMERPPRTSSKGGWPARRATGRWAWRLFRKEWRQQLLVLALLTIAVAVTVLGMGLAANASLSSDAKFGDADYLLSIPATNTSFAQDLASATAAFDVSETVYHSHIAVPGSVTPIDVRAQSPVGQLSGPTLELREGAWPTGANEIALTAGVMKTFDLALGGTWETDAQTWNVVGVVENPLDLVDDFALSSPDVPAQFDSVTIWGTTSGAEPDALNISGATLSVRSPGVNTQAEVLTLVLAAVGAIFVGLVAVAGFAVVAQRRLRGLGMLGALGATPRLTRFALVSNGAIVGLFGAVAGGILGVIAWSIVAPAFEAAVNHRIDRTNLPWTALCAVIVLGVATSVVGAWWPARTAARTPIVSALALRPPPPRKAHVLGVPGAVVMAAGMALIAFAPTTLPALATLGVAATAVGMLLVAPLGLSLLASGTRRTPLAIRLAVRDLVRYRARSSGSVAAVSLAVAIAVAISVSAGAAQVSANSAANGGNLPDNEVMLWLGSAGAIGPIPVLVPAQLSAVQDAVDSIVVELGADSSLALDAAVDPTISGGTHVGDTDSAGTPTYDAVQLGIPHDVVEDGRPGKSFNGNEAVPIFVSTPQILTHYGVAQDSIAGDVDFVTAHQNLDGYEVIPIRVDSWVPVVQHADLPTYSSDPTTLITQHAMDTLSLTAVPTSWLLTFTDPLTSDQRDQARTLAAKAGLSVELRPTTADLAPARIAVTTGGIALALAVLAMTVGLIRSETSGDLSTLAATGASSRVRRVITASTAGGLGLVGAVLGTATAYLALIAWHHHDLSVLVPVPVVQLCVIVLGLPVAAWLVGWLLGGREPYVLARRRLE